ncbi:MAG: hypothetical protein GYA23_02945 [Methanomicrobiales archaeon]|nr:hypothetical protein [Methanomicrobiales archaeon]
MTPDTPHDDKPDPEGGTAGTESRDDYLRRPDDILITMPERMSFWSHYLMAGVPVVLVILCIGVRIVLENLFHVSTASLYSAIPSSLSPYTSGFTSQYTASLAGATSIAILLIAPVGIFLFVIIAGWALRQTEMWVSTFLCIGVSVPAALLMTAATGYPPSSTDYLIRLLQWTAFFVQPFSVIAAVAVLVGTEKYRQSIRYRITPSGTWIQGGLFGLQEHMIPHNQVGRIVLEQDYFGARSNYGTLIPVSTTRWGTETSLRALGAAGQRDNAGLGIGYARGREEGSRDPLDCLYGISGPRNVQKILSGLICRQDEQQDQQVAYLKKIYELSVAGAGNAASMPGVPTTPEQPVVTRITSLDELENKPVAGYRPAGSIPPQPACIVTRITDIGTCDAPAGERAITREIPPLPGNANKPAQSPAPQESPLDQIKKLAGLRDASIITEEEFAEKKADLLRRV